MAMVMVTAMATAPIAMGTMKTKNKKHSLVK